MESPHTPPPAPRGTKRLRSPSPITPSPWRSVPIQPPSAPARRGRLSQPDFGVARNLLNLFEEEAHLLQEAEEFHAEQDGLEQQVPTGEEEEASVGDIVLPSNISFAWFYGEEEILESDDDDF